MYSGSMLSVVFFCFPTEHPEEGEGRVEEPEENVGSTSLIVNEPPQPPKDFSESHVYEGSRCTVGVAYYQILSACAIYDISGLFHHPGLCVQYCRYCACIQFYLTLISRMQVAPYTCTCISASLSGLQKRLQAFTHLQRAW